MNLAGLRLHYRFDDEATGGDGPAPDDLDHPLFRMLQAVENAGSIQHAATGLGVSYRHLWGRLRDWERRLGEPLVHWVRGQPARLTPAAQVWLQRERLARARIAPEVETIRQTLADALRPAAGGAPWPLELVAEFDPMVVALVDRAREDGAAALRLRFACQGGAREVLRTGRVAVATLLPPPEASSGRATGAVRPLLRAACFRSRLGLMLAAGNPLALRSLDEVLQRRLRFVPAEPGSAADRLARRLGAGDRTDRVDGREPTPAAAALRVATGRADAALGPQAVAQALGLDFIPLLEDDTVLLCTPEQAEHPALEALLAVLRSPGWAARLASTPGTVPSADAGVLRTCTLDDAGP